VLHLKAAITRFTNVLNFQLPTVSSWTQRLIRTIISLTSPKLRSWGLDALGPIFGIVSKKMLLHSLVERLGTAETPSQNLSPPTAYSSKSDIVNWE
jgi:hypothetical protein